MINDDDDVYQILYVYSPDGAITAFADYRIPGCPRSML